MLSEYNPNMSTQNQVDALGETCHELANICHDFANTFLSHQAEIESLLEITEQEISSSGYIKYKKHELHKLVICFMERLANFTPHIMK